MAPHSSILVWKIPWTEEPGRLQSVGSLRAGHDWATSLLLFTFMCWRRKWQPTTSSCLENPRDVGAWWAAVYGVAQSRTRLKWLSSSIFVLFCFSVSISHYSFLVLFQEGKKAGGRWGLTYIRKQEEGEEKRKPSTAKSAIWWIYPSEGVTTAQGSPVSYSSEKKGERNQRQHTDWPSVSFPTLFLVNSR